MPRLLPSLCLGALLAAGCLRAPAAPRAHRGSGDWSFEVTVGPDARELTVTADLAPGSGEELSVDTEAEPFVQEVQLLTPSGWSPLPPDGTSWRAPACRSGCRLRYRFQLARAAQAIDDIERAARIRDALFAPPSTWLLHPLQQTTVGRWSLKVEGTSPFHSGLLPGREGYEAATDDLAGSPYSAFGGFETRTLTFPGGKLEVAMPPGVFDDQERAEIERWARRAGEAIVGVYGRFPLPRALLFVLEGEAPGVGFGRTLGNGGASILVSVGHPARRAELQGDWMLPHELIHLAFPSVPAHQSWMEEGLSTYIEPVARARAGQLQEEDLWRDFILSMPQGQPEPGDQGLDRTATWGRTYWGGALFCLQADVEIRKRTDNRRTLLDALRAINEADGNVMHRWPLERALDLGDQATGTTVLKELHERHGTHPVTVDLEALWSALGVRLRGGRLLFDDTAPLASIRHAIPRRP